MSIPPGVITLQNVDTLIERLGLKTLSPTTIDDAFHSSLILRTKVSA
ncbi:MAG: hypothetical protein WB643_00945 [Candidatus Bathyarchaeia archaeon]